MSIQVTNVGPVPAADVEAEFRRRGLHFLKLDVPPVDNTSHWHSFSSTFQVVAGTVHLTDIASGKSHAAGPGARVSVPEKVLHAERSEQGYSILLGVTRDPRTFEEPVNLRPEDLPASGG